MGISTWTNKKETPESNFHNEGDCEIESVRASADISPEPSLEEEEGQFTKCSNTLNQLSDTEGSVYYCHPGKSKGPNGDGKNSCATSLTEKASSKSSTFTLVEKQSGDSPNKKPGGRAKSKQKGISKLSTQRKKKTVHQTAMDRLLYEIAVRTQHKAKSLEFEAKNLSDTVDNLRHENRALKRLQRSQTREIHDRHDFVDMANLSLKGFRKDVRFSEENRVDADVSVRKKTKKVIRLENESKRYENLLQLDSKLPSIEELEQKIEKADRDLELKDERLKELQTKLELDDQRITQEQKKEKKRFVKLQHEIDETVRECHDLTSRIKTAERKIHKTNIYCRKRGPSTQALPAITWYPPAIEQSPTNKVQTWLNKNSDSST